MKAVLWKLSLYHVPLASKHWVTWGGLIWTPQKSTQKIDLRPFTSLHLRRYSPGRRLGVIFHIFETMLGKFSQFPLPRGSDGETRNWEWLVNHGSYINDLRFGGDFKDTLIRWLEGPGKKNPPPKKWRSSFVRAPRVRATAISLAQVWWSSGLWSHGILNYWLFKGKGCNRSYKWPNVNG